MKTLIKYFEDWTIFEKLWILIFTLVNVYLYFAWGDTIIGLITSITGMFCVVLSAKGRISNFYPGIINVILYAYISYGNKYYGETILNALYFLPMQFVGIYIWNKHKYEKEFDKVKIKFLSNKQRIKWTIITIFSVYITSIILEKIGTELPLMGAISMAMSVIAMYLMTKRYMEQWILWIIIDVATIVMWIVVFLKSGNDISMLVMWVAYLINAIYGVINWIFEYKKQQKSNI